MLQQVFTHTPAWVWLLLPALFWLGFSQTRPRTASLRRVTLMPLAMVSLSLYSTVTAFSAHAGVLVAWLGGAPLATGGPGGRAHEPDAAAWCHALIARQHRQCSFLCCASPVKLPSFQSAHLPHRQAPPVIQERPVKP